MSSLPTASAIGKVDAVEGQRIKLTKDASPDGKHHHVDLSDVARVDSHVHLSKTRAALGLAAAARPRPGAAKPANPLPPLRNPTVDGATPRRNFMLPWVLGGLALARADPRARHLRGRQGWPRRARPPMPRCPRS